MYLNTSNVINKQLLRKLGALYQLYLNTSNVINKRVAEILRTEGYTEFKYIKCY